jgi:phage FluMu protein Com
VHQVLTREPSASPAIRCQVCATKIVVPGVEDVVVKNAILRVDRASGHVAAKCPRCKTWVDVPLRYIG